jgi:hypothetical protein
MRRSILVTACLLAVGLTLAGCGGSSAQKAAQDASNHLQGQVYQAKHHVEFRNYNLRQKVADDPSTILWCTFFPPTTGQEPFTVPIAGKLTSSNKRPYRATTEADNGAPGTEVPGPDAMYGSSSEYRYGFDPTLSTYYDFTDLASFCTTSPTVWQANQTKIVVQTQSTLDNLSRAASAAIQRGDPKKALALLKQAEAVQTKAQGQ